MDKKNFKEVIDMYHSKIKDGDEYVMSFDEEIEVTGYSMTSGELIDSKVKEAPTATLDLLNLPFETLSKEAIENLSPDNIDIGEFWEYAIEKFPLLSVSSYPKCKTEDDVNKANLNAALFSGFLPKINMLLKKKPNCKVLEIGPGYGNMFRHILDNFDRCNYNAIDVNPLFYYDGLFKCDGSTIPNEVGRNVDLVFSWNAFQHLSKKQRSSYYKEIYDSLRDGGRFVFNNFLLTEENKNEDIYWSYKDEEGKPYVTFFSQLTPVDSYEELADELNDLGFLVHVSLSQNSAIIDCKKQENG